MTSVRKKKKPKSDARASEQMRNWLTKHKNKKNTPPVTFSIFSKTLENLPDIAFQIQCHELGFANKTLDECALWYYNAFYSDPSVRTKYEFRLRSCPLRIKEELLQVRSEEASTDASCEDDNNNDRVPTADGFEVKVNKGGRFLFPVSFSTFERYINKEEVLEMLVQKETRDKAKCAAMLKDDHICRKLLRKYYNGFYIFPSKSQLEKVKFTRAPPALRQQLMKRGIPLDELAMTTLEKKSNQPKSSKSLLPVANELSSRCSIISFVIFEKFIKNIYDIVWRLKLNEPEFAYKGFEDCAYEYYLAFYLTPEIREKYPYQLAPCTTAMKRRILALPSPEDAKALLRLKNQAQLLSASQQSEPQMDEAQPTVQTEIAADPAMECEEQQSLNEVAAPVTFEFFKRYIKNLDQVVKKMLACDEYKGRTKDECAMEYFRKFYSDPQIRERFGYELRPCPGRIREKLLSLPFNVEYLLCCNKSSNEQNPVLTAEPKLVTIEGKTYEFLVSFETFLRYINYDELKPQLAKAYEKKKGKSSNKPSNMKLINRFYHSFYVDVKLREEFNYNFNAAPAQLRETLMKPAVLIASTGQPTSEREGQIETTTPNEMCVVSEGQNEEVPPTQIEDSDVEIDVMTNFVWKLDVVEDLGKAGRFRFPVSFETFKHCINFDDLIKLLLKRVTEDEPQMAAMVANPMHPQCQKIFKRYYRSFYVRPNTRSLYEYRFSKVSAELLQKLMDYAVPLDENAKKTVAEAANEVSENKAEKATNEPSKELPVKFQLFKRFIKNLDEIAKQMLSCEEYNGRSEDECALEYFMAFYTDSKIRERFKYELKPCPAQLRDKLLMLPAAMPETQRQQQPDVEDRNPDDAQLKESEPEPEPEEPLIEVCTLTPETPDGNCISAQNNNKEMLVQSERILITIEGITYEFPVSLQTFKRFINYDTVSVELANSYFKNKPKDKKVSRDKRLDLVLLRRFYHSFYVDAKIRNLFNFNFNAAPLEMQQKLLQFAIPCTQNVLTSSSPLPTHCADNNNENLTEAITGDPVAEQQFDQVFEEQVENPQSLCSAAIEYPVSYNIFSKILNLDEVVEQMQQEAPYSKMTANECRLAFFDAFYRTPEIRAKYKCTLKPCPALLRAKLLQIPQAEARTMLDEHTYSNSPSESCENTESVAALYAARKAELARMDKSNVVKYTPHNLSAYIALRTQCPIKRNLLEKHFIGTQKPQQKKTVKDVAPSSETTEESLTLEQSTGTAAKTQCSKVVVASQCETSATERVETVSVRDLSTTSTAIRTETITAQTVENSGTAAVMGTSATISETTVTSTAPASSAAAAPTASNVVSTSLLKPTETKSQSNVSEASTTTVESTGTVLKAATASTSIPADKALQSTASSQLHVRTIDEINLRAGKDQNTLACTTNPTALNPSTVAKAQAEAEFFADSSEEHNMRYLLCTSHGLKKAIWRILSQLSYTEFKTYTNIYADASLHMDESFLSRCYNHVLEKGNWPVNLFVKLQMLPQLLRSKGVQLDALDLGQMSPKMLHWQELIRFSNFQDIVERFFEARTGQEIDDMQELFNEFDKFYSMCWSSDKWIYQVPQITEELMQSISWTQAVTNNEPIPPVTRPHCMIGDSAPASITISDSPEESLAATDAPDTTAPDLNANIALEESVCPPTQLNLSLCPPCFVDIQNVCPASQVMECQNDPLNESSISTAANPVHIKQEKVQFLNNMRFSINSNSESEKFICESIPNEIIDVDSEENEQEAAKLACFAMNTTQDSNTTAISCTTSLHLSKDSSQDVLAEVQKLTDVLPSPTDVMWGPPTTQTELQAPSAETGETTTANEIEDGEAEPIGEMPSMEMSPLEVTPMEVTPMEVTPMEVTPMEVTPMEVTPMEVTPNPVQPIATASRPIIPKPPIPATAVSRKKPRLMADNVPQLRHEFRPLPLTAMVRIEADGMNTYLNKQQSQQQDQATSSNQVQQLPGQPSQEARNTMTVSQELATDKTLMESSQLQQLLDAPFVSQRKVNAVDEVSDSNKNDRVTSIQAPSVAPAEKHKCYVFRTLVRFMYFSALTTAQISKYHINSLTVGSPYQQALIGVNGQLCNVYGPLLETLFSNCTPSLLADLQFLLSDIDEFSFNDRKRLKKDSTEDLRTRVIYAFMAVATPFAHFRLNFENSTREWAACSVVDKQDNRSMRRKPKYDVSSGIRPEILERMKQVKCLLNSGH